MTLLYYDPIFLEHQTGDHPECAARLEAIVRHLESSALDSRCSRPTWQAATAGELSLVHDPEHVVAVQAFAEGGGGWLDSDTHVSAHSYEAATMAAGAVCDAVRRVVSGEDTQAMCLVRPPGHHALASNAMGFCLFNNIAVGAALAAADLDLDRVLIVDWDVHHGNGTQAMFWEASQVGFLSTHRWPFYPGTGAADEVGSGDGLGTTLNVPVRFGTPRDEYLDAFAAALDTIASKMQPQLVLVSAGFDSHHLDPVGSLGLDTEDFAIMTERILEVADAHAGGRIVSVLEGGYHPAALADCVGIHLGKLLEWQGTQEDVD